ncbi:MAG: hypothetical protein CMH31_05345 [Micavibrio sp.]|nr:hypothetical protein [Micavibrio sp.]|tara:strand:- start:260 stop:1555 length:1296 start_codon:yes stop_codon:yes gene_type:complete
MQALKSLLNSNIGKGAVGTLALNLCNQVFIFLTLVLLARVMSPEAFGLYSVILSTMTLIALPFLGGFTTFVMRHVAVYRAQEKWSALKGVLKYSLLWIIIGSGLFILIALFFIQNDFYKWGLPIIFLMPMLLFFGAILRGLKKVVHGRFSEFFLQPFIFFLISAFAYFKGNEIDSDVVLQFYCMSIIIGICVSAFLAFKKLPKQMFSAVSIYKGGEWLKSAIPLIFAVGLVVTNMNIDIVMVGALAGEEQAGQYRVASRMAAFVLFILFASNNAVSPRISALYEAGEKEKLQSIITRTARITLIATLPIALTMILFSKIILSLSFGEVFVLASTCLIILSFANLFAVFMGQVGQVMSLTGHEKYTAFAVFIAVIINVSLNYMLVPSMGMNGAAIATGVSIVVWNGVLAFWTVRKTGLYCTALGPIGKRAVE